MFRFSELRSFSFTFQASYAVIRNDITTFEAYSGHRARCIGHTEFFEERVRGVGVRIQNDVL